MAHPAYRYSSDTGTAPMEGDLRPPVRRSTSNSFLRLGSKYQTFKAQLFEWNSTCKHESGLLLEEVVSFSISLEASTGLISCSAQKTPFTEGSALSTTSSSKSVHSFQSDSTTCLPAGGKEDTTQSEDEEETYMALGVAEFLDNVVFHWEEFLNPVEQMVQKITHQSATRKASEKGEAPENDYENMFRDLDQLQPLWLDIIKALSTTKTVVRRLRDYVSSTDQNNNKIKKYIKHQIRTIDNLFDLTTRLSKQSRDLADRIINLASLEESKANKNIATNVGRIAIITFVLLPLQLGAAILQEIDNDGVPDHTWIFIALTAGIMTWTVFWWCSWAYFTRWALWVKEACSFKMWRKEEDTSGDSKV